MFGRRIWENRLRNGCAWFSGCDTIFRMWIGTSHRYTMTTTIYLPRHQTRMTRSSKRAVSRYKRQRRYLCDRQDGEGGWARWIVESVEKPPGRRKRNNGNCEREKKVEWKIRRSENDSEERTSERLRDEILKSSILRVRGDSRAARGTVAEPKKRKKKPAIEEEKRKEGRARDEIVVEDRRNKDSER